jgi:hypothetical protein
MNDKTEFENVDNNKPFDDKEPFDANVEADEDADPKKFIQQLAGKIGQSLRSYTKELGKPDFELEKFVINSVISATNTSEMSDEDQKDIIKKIKKSNVELPEKDSTDTETETPETPETSEVPEEENKNVGESTLKNIIKKSLKETYLENNNIDQIIDEVLKDFNYNDKTNTTIKTSTKEKIWTPKPYTKKD